MSGIEVAGLVMGAFPIAIKAYGTYEEVVKRYRFWRKIRQEHRKWSSDLAAERIIFRTRLEELLLTSHLEDDKVEELLTGADLTAWNDPVVERCIRERLQGSYDVYLGIVTNIQEILEELGHELALDSTVIQDTIKSPDPATGRPSRWKEDVEFHLYRLKFSGSNEQRQQLLMNLTNHNERIMKLLSSTDKKAQLVQQRAGVGAKVAIDTAILSFWRQAKVLFDALQVSWDCCSCSLDHFTNILLYHPSTSAAMKKRQYEVLFATATDDKKVWTLRPTLITVGHEDGEKQNEQPTTQLTTIPPQMADPSHGQPG